MEKRVKILVLIATVFVIIFIYALFFLFPKKVFLGPGELSVERMLPPEASLNQEFEVALQVYTPTDKPLAIGIKEQIPTGWLVGEIQNSHFTKISENNVEFLLFNLKDIEDTTIVYTITPTTTSSSFSGSWESINPDLTGSITGHSGVRVEASDSCGNGECIGETCETCPADCGTCAAEPGTTQTTQTEATQTQTTTTQTQTTETSPTQPALLSPIINYSKQHPVMIIIISGSLILIIIIIILLIIITRKHKTELLAVQPYIMKAKSQGYTPQQIQKAMEKKNYPSWLKKKVNKQLNKK